jgi:5-methylcytosine-specific restriction endonuclease McrA
MEFPPSFAHFSDHDLVAEVKRLAACERQAMTRLIECLMEVDARRLYLGEGCSSLFTYCTQVLHLSEHAAYGRIEAARTARRFPVILRLLADGELTLTAVNLLAPHLTPDNHLALLKSARHKSKREVEHLSAQMHPRPDVPSSVRKLPMPKPAALSESTDEPRGDATNSAKSAECPEVLQRKSVSVVAPLASERYKVQFTVSRETYEKLRRAQDLMRHTVSDGDPAVVFDRALTLLVLELERTRLAATKKWRCRRPTAPTSRHIPAEVKRLVWKRDAGRCAFVGTNGRCTETGFLEFHHVVPYATGGAATFENIQLRCAAHNAHEAELYFGRQQPTLVRETGPPYVVQ